MEGGRVRVRAVLVVGLVLGLLLGQSDAFSPICYAGCVGECLVFHGSLMTCAIKCIWKCLFALSDTPPDSHSLCKFNCAAKLCANITTADHLGISLSLSLSLSLILFVYVFLLYFSCFCLVGAEEVESCVNSCGGNCTQNYLSS